MAMDTITNTPIPVENSPLDGEALYQLLSRGGAVGVDRPPPLVKKVGLDRS